MDDLKILISAVLKDDVETKINTEIGKLKINELKIPISVSTEQIKKVLSELNVTINNSNANQPKIKIFDTGDLDSQKIKYFKGIDDIENRVKAFYSKTGKTDVTLFKNAQKDITGFTASVTDSSGVLQKFKFKLAQLGDALGDQVGFVYDGESIVDKLVGTNVDSKLDKLNQLKNTLISLQDRAFNLTKPVQQTDHVTDLKNQYAAIEKEIKRIEASGNAMSKSEIRNLNNLVKEADRTRKKYQELERPAKDMEAKPLSYTKSEYIAELTAMEKKLANSGVLIGDVKNKFIELKTAAGSINDKKSLEKFKNDFVLFKKEASGATTTLRKFNAETAQSIARNKLEIFLQQNPKALKANSQGFKELDESIKGITNTTNRTNWNQKFTEVTGTVENLGKTGNTIFGNLTKNASKFLAWLVSSGAVMGAISTFKQMITVVIDLDKALVNLQMATGNTYAETLILLDSYNKLGQRLGSTTKEIADAANSWLRQGMNISDTNTMIENSLILSKVGMIGSAEATQYMTSAMKGYGYSVEKTLGIVDMLSGIDLVSATDAGGLADAMSRTAASANIAGVEMSKLLSYLATVGEVTQKDMTNIGESFNFGAATA